MNKRKTAAPDSSTLFTFFNEIGIISQLTNTMFEHQLPRGLTSSQFAVLNWFMRVDSEATPGRLAAAFQVTGGAMTNTLKKLAAKDLIKIEPDATSGRKKRVTITANGRAMRNKAITAVAPMLKEFAEEFPVSKIEKQLKDLQKIRQYLDSYRFREN